MTIAMLAGTVLTARDLAQLWRQFAQDETLPDRYELTERGELVMSPSPTNRHQRLRGLVATQLSQQLGGEAVVEPAVLTKNAGVRRPDVVWMPTARWNALTEENDLLQAPDLVIEVLSPGNRRAEMAHKVLAYLNSGITEVIVMALDGTIAFHRADGVRAQSAFAIKLDLPAALFS